MKLRDIDRLLSPIRRRLGALMKRGVWLRREADAGTQLGQVSLLSGETRGRVEKLEQYGFTSAALAGAEAFATAVGGSADHCLVLCVADRRYRLRGLQDGEVAIYDDLGKAVILKRDGTIEIRAPSGVDLLGDLRVHGDIAATGDVADAEGTLADLRDTYNLHTHPEHDGGATGPPTQQA